MKYPFYEPHGYFIYFFSLESASQSEIELAHHALGLISHHQETNREKREGEHSSAPVLQKKKKEQSVDFYYFMTSFYFKDSIRQI